MTESACGNFEILLNQWLFVNHYIQAGGRQKCRPFCFTINLTARFQAVIIYLFLLRSYSLTYLSATVKIFSYFASSLERALLKKRYAFSFLESLARRRAVYSCVALRSGFSSIEMEKFIKRCSSLNCRKLQYLNRNSER